MNRKLLHSCAVVLAITSSGMCYASGSSVAGAHKKPPAAASTPRFQEGDSVFIMGSDFINGKYYWLKASVNKLNGNATKINVSIESVCIRNALDEVRCKNDDSDQPYKVGNNYWLDISDVRSDVPALVR